MKKVVKILGIVVLVAGLAYLGITVYGNFMAPQPTAKTEYPDVSTAKYAFVISSTGQLYFCNDYDCYGQEPKRFFMLHGYWDRSGQVFKYRDRDLPLDENIFGLIQVTKR